jgi:uncharacterized protein YjbI with pentapeptide repeats
MGWKAPIEPAPPDLPEQLTPLREVFARADLQIAECRLEDVDLSASVLKGMSMKDVVVLGGTWANADLSNANLLRVEMRGVRLTGAILSGSKMSDVSFIDCRMDLTVIRFSELERVRFENCLLQEADLYETKLSSSVFSACDLSKVSLANTTFEQSEMRDCDLEGASDPAGLRGVGMPWPDIIRSAGALAIAAEVHILDDE